MRGIVRSPILASHPLVSEFLKTDHSLRDKRFGIKNFSKELVNYEAGYVKMSSYYEKQKMANGVYRITSTKPKISLKEDFTADLLDDKNITMLNFNEKEFVLRYD